MPRLPICPRCWPAISRRCRTRSPIWPPMRWACWTCSPSRKHMSSARPWGPDCTNDGHGASRPCPLSHVDDVHNGQPVRRTTFTGHAPRGVLGPPAVTRDEVIQRMLRAMRAVGSPGYPSDQNEIAARAGRAYDRGYDPVGVARQAIATVASGDRTDRLRDLKVPAMVIHGLADRMCDVTGGQATAEAIPGAELILIEGMGHDLPPGLRLQLAARIA